MQNLIKKTLILCFLFLISCGEAKKQDKTVVFEKTPTQPSEIQPEAQLSAEEIEFFERQDVCLKTVSTEISFVLWHFCPTSSDLNKSIDGSMSPTLATFVGTKWAFGYGKSLGVSFSGRTDQYVTVPTRAKLDLISDFTISAWIKRYGNGTIISKYQIIPGAEDELTRLGDILAAKFAAKGFSSSSFELEEFKRLRDNFPIAFGYRLKLTEANELELTISGYSAKQSVSIPEGEWTHIAVTWNKKAAEFYINGKSIGLHPLDFKLRAAPNIDVYVGIDNATSGSPFKGIISDLKFFKKEKTEQEICDDTGLLSCKPQAPALPEPEPVLVPQPEVQPQPESVPSPQSESVLQPQPEPEPILQPQQEPQPESQIANKLVAWHLCKPEIGNISDDCSNMNNNGIIHDAIRTEGPNNALGGLEFITGSLLSVSHSNTLDIIGPLTISAWIKLKSLGSVGMIVAKYENSDGYEFYVQESSLRLAVSGRSVGTPNILPLNTWVHVAVSWDKITAKIYINGKLQSAVPYPDVLKSTTFPLAIGRRPVTNQFSFNGFISDVKIYNYARSDNEICLDSGLTDCP